MDLGEDLISLVCLVLNAIALVRCGKSENLDAMNGVGASVFWATGQSGGAPDRRCSLSGAPSGSALTLARTVAHLIPSAGDRWREVAVAPLAHRTVRCARPGHTSADFCSLYLNPFSVFILVCCEPLAPVELII